MKAIILAGGLGTRLSEETHLKPKPMIEIGGKPILWHIMKIYAHYGVNDFVICCGFKGYVIKEYFANYFLHMSDVTFDMQGLQINRRLCWCGSIAKEVGRSLAELPFLLRNLMRMHFKPLCQFGQRLVATQCRQRHLSFEHR